MKHLMEIWRNTLQEKEQGVAEKAKVLASAQQEVQGLITKVQSATGGDSGLTREVLESVLIDLQQALEEL
jgi:hypothetical protein